MVNSARLFNCASCRRQVVLCRRCDRGNAYCSRDCGEAARRQSQRVAGQRYQNSRRGRQKHAQRQRRYRERQRCPMPEKSHPQAESDASPFDQRTAAYCCGAHAGGAIRNPALRVRPSRQRCSAATAAAGSAGEALIWRCDQCSSAGGGGNGDHPGRNGSSDPAASSVPWANAPHDGPIGIALTCSRGSCSDDCFRIPLFRGRSTYVERNSCPRGRSPRRA